MSNEHKPEPFGYFAVDPFYGWVESEETHEGSQPLYDQAAVDALAKQRDELLAVLERLNTGSELGDWLSSTGMPFAAAKDLREIDEAIASVKGDRQ